MRLLLNLSGFDYINVNRIEFVEKSRKLTINTEMHNVHYGRKKTCWSKCDVCLLFMLLIFFDPHTSEMCVSHWMPYASQLWFDGHLLCILWVFEQLVKTKISIFMCITYHVADFRFILFISGLVGFIFSNGIVSMSNG